MAVSHDLSNNIPDTDLWSGTWFQQRNHLIEYTCIHAALLQAPKYGSYLERQAIDTILSDTWTGSVGGESACLERIVSEPYGLDASEIIPSNILSQWMIHQTSKVLLENMQPVTTFTDTAGICCIMLNNAFGRMIWLIHASKLVLFPPKSKRRGIHDDTKRVYTLVGIDVLSAYIAKQCAIKHQLFASLPNILFLEALLKCWIVYRYDTFCYYLRQSLNHNTTDVRQYFESKLSGHDYANALVKLLLDQISIGTSVILLDVTWFLSRFNIYQKLVDMRIPIETCATITSHLSQARRC